MAASPTSALRLREAETAWTLLSSDYRPGSASSRWCGPGWPNWPPGGRTGRRRRQPTISCGIWSPFRPGCWPQTVVLARFSGNSWPARFERFPISSSAPTRSCSGPSSISSCRSPCRPSSRNRSRGMPRRRCLTRGWSGSRFLSTCLRRRYTLPARWRPTSWQRPV